MSTPIGNLEDITLRAVRLLKEVDLVAAEDTRKARLLFNKHGIKNRLTSYHEQNKRNKLPELLNLLESGKNIALISEAGTPGLNDPGYELVVACIQQGIKIVPVPGPSAIITALVVSGLPTDKFVYIGYLPRKPGERTRYLESLRPEPRTIVCLEAPHRLRASLDDVFKILGDRKIAVCRELTKIHEEIFRGLISEAIARFQEPRGEFTLVIEGSNRDQKPDGSEAEKEAARLLEKYRSEGLGAKESVTRVCTATGLHRKQVYKLWLKLINKIG